MNVNAKLRFILNRMGITPSELARRTGLTKQAISRLLRDGRGMNISTLVKICSGINITPSELLGFKGPKDEQLKSRGVILGLEERILNAVAALTKKDP